jgi:hypothetical protein
MVIVLIGSFLVADHLVLIDLNFRLGSMTNITCTAELFSVGRWCQLCPLSTHEIRPWPGRAARPRRPPHRLCCPGVGAPGAATCGGGVSGRLDAWGVSRAMRSTPP